MRPFLAFVNGKAVIQTAAKQEVDTEKVRAGKQVISKDNQKSSSLNYMQREQCDRWSKEDIDKFYKGLQLFGTDFGMIESGVF